MNSSGSSVDVSWKYPATLQHVEQVCIAAEKELKKYSLPGKELFAVQLLLREAINNAVLHGCRLDPSLSFFCRLVISDREIIIDVLDDGTGFDWRKEPVAPGDDLNESGRGLSIYALYAHLINFNDAGNGVTLTRNLHAAAGAAGNRQGERND
jgi:serine/threonine-protein kinase RsbW